MIRARFFLPLLLVLPLAGCFAGQRDQLASCQQQAAAANPHPKPGQLLKAAQTCMDKAGYNFIGWNDGVVCDMGALTRGEIGQGGAATLCFEPRGWLERKLYRLEVPERTQQSTDQG
jgi:hypothetical protein